MIPEMDFLEKALQSEQIGIYAEYPLVMNHTPDGGIPPLHILYEDNHFLLVNKPAGVLAQGDKTGDPSIADIAKAHIAARDKKPGNVFMGIPHRLDRPTSGVIVLAKTGKALSRMTALFRDGPVKKVYWCILDTSPPQESGTLEHYLVRNSKKNKSFVSAPDDKRAKKAVLHYKIIASSDNYYLAEVVLETGRHHQIRAQFAAIGCRIKGDLKYGAKRSNPGGGICLHARQITFEHPVKKEELAVTAPVPDDTLWNFFLDALE